MRADAMTPKQAIIVLMFFTVGSSLDVGLNSASRQDAWLAIVIGLLLAIPLIWAFARLLSLYPGQSLYDIILDVFGRVAGRIVLLLFLLHIIMVGALILRNFADFLLVVTLPETPEFVFFLFMFALCVWMVKSGMGAFGRWAKFVLPLVLFVEAFMFLISVKDMDFDNLKPVMGSNFNTLLGSSFLLFSLPFTETVIVAFLFGRIRPAGNPYFIYGVGVSAGALILLAATLANILLLGGAALGKFYFPSYRSASIVTLGDFFNRVEVLVGMFFMLTGFAKICVCMFAAAEGFSKLLNKQECRDMAIPAALLMLVLAQILFSNTFELYTWLQTVFPYYALPFQVALPLITLAGAEIKTKIRKCSNSAE